MEASVVALLLIFAAVAFASAVVTVAIGSMQQTLNPHDNPQLNDTASLKNSLINMANAALNQTTPGIPNP